MSLSSYRKRSKKLKNLIFAQLQTLKNYSFSIQFYFFRLDYENSESLKVYCKRIDQIIPISLIHGKWMKILKIDQSATGPGYRFLSFQSFSCASTKVKRIQQRVSDAPLNLSFSVFFNSLISQKLRVFMHGRNYTISFFYSILNLIS